jgi:magnesium-transporting ATPase (P-type)
VLPNGNLKYNSQSPDETALVQAAKNFGFVFKERTQESLTLEVPHLSLYSLVQHSQDYWECLAETQVSQMLLQSEII